MTSLAAVSLPVRGRGEGELLHRAADEEVVAGDGGEAAVVWGVGEFIAAGGEGLVATCCQREGLAGREGQAGGSPEFEGDAAAGCDRVGFDLDGLAYGGTGGEREQEARLVLAARTDAQTYNLDVILSSVHENAGLFQRVKL